MWKQWKAGFSVGISRKLSVIISRIFTSPPLFAPFVAGYLPEREDSSPTRDFLHKAHEVVLLSLLHRIKAKDRVSVYTNAGGKT